MGCNNSIPAKNSVAPIPQPSEKVDLKADTTSEMAPKDEISYDDHLVHHAKDIPLPSEKVDLKANTTNEMAPKGEISYDDDLVHRAKTATYRREYDSALMYYEKLLCLRQQELSEGNVLVGDSLCGVGMLKRLLGNAIEAQTHLEKALTIYRNQATVDDMRVAAALRELALVFTDKKEFAIALSTNRQVLDIYDRILPKGHPSVGKVHNNIASVHEALGEWGFAMIHYQKFVDISEESNASGNHPHVGIGYHNLGRMYEMNGNYKTALVHYKKAEAILLKTLQPSHPKTLAVDESIRNLVTKMSNA
ncbi:unnamed protein product [Didymodactylos carnosus]|uniref:Kinesin light chain n=1 Tax=Didymodactylos carnosus TaxID=1234261 RepID=A0A813X4Q6_9BILA|nr:unnamed protein product [Didymodactylos carnosus]CAF1423158.1 unnamed protein product [Didymodactylos carnosus]CAF3647442.1 unnamed protein product [Didymodactylos carnosus]CAF4223264.1 unnamed protein product [Didymodactylos carnosus]